MQTALQHTNQFLTQLNKLVDWDEYLDKLINLYKGKAEFGRPIYKPTLVLKMLFLSYLFNVSEREIERTVNDSISMKDFLGLALDEHAPDHSLLTKFKDRIMHNDSVEILHDMFDDIISLAMAAGIDLGHTQVIDSTHTIANVNRKKDKQRQNEGKKPRDPGARTGVKRTDEVKTITGEKVKVPFYVYGYKTHTSVSAKSNLFTALAVTAANAFDGHYFERLMKKDLALDVAIPGKTIYTADKAYDDGENHAWLFSYQLKNAICLKGSPQEIAEKRTVFYHQLTGQQEYDKGKSQRYIVERAYADTKSHHGFDRCRYLGKLKMEMQAYLTSIVHNLKILVTELTGAKLRCQSFPHVF